MGRILGIRFRRAGHIDYCDAGSLDLDVDDHVIVQTPKGVEMGRVVAAAGQFAAVEPPQPPLPIMRRAGPEDLNRAAYFRSRESDALARCRERISRHGLPMKLLNAEYAFDGSRLTFHFCADGRVDFRDLVRDLASTFRTRIELRQVGPRDETKIVGGVARCGRDLCCASWLREFSPVSMRMAKNQDLPLTDSRLGGICGRLMCCLAYENAAYAHARDECPNAMARSACEARPPDGANGSLPSAAPPPPGSTDPGQ